MSSALKLEPRCPDPARLIATSAFRRHMSASSARRASGSAVGRCANSIELGAGDQGQVRHVRHESIRCGPARLPSTPIVASRTKAGVTGTEYSATA